MLVKATPEIASVSTAMYGSFRRKKLALRGWSRESAVSRARLGSLIGNPIQDNDPSIIARTP